MQRLVNGPPPMGFMPAPVSEPPVPRNRGDIFHGSRELSWKALV